MPTRYKRLSTKKVFVGRGDIKHTSSNVLITVYVHNTDKMYLNRARHLVYKALFRPNKELKKFINKDVNNKEVITYNRPLTLKEFLTLPDHYNQWYTDHIASYIEIQNLYLTNLNKQYVLLTKLVDIEMLAEEDKYKLFMDMCENINIFNHPDYDAYMAKVDYYYQSNFRRLKYLLAFNNVKFTKPFINELTTLVQSIYGKRVAFNIVNLKKMHLNSDIFTQAVSLKLKNRDNKLYRVLKSSLRKVKLPFEDRIAYKANKINKDEIFANKIRNNLISSMFHEDNAVDSLNNLLLNFFPSAENLMVNTIRRSSIKERSISLKNYILKSIKHLNVRGVRVEAKGRLTRRFTASRSVFKMKWKGGLKNVDSSFKGLSAIMLRGYAKSNVQYSFLSSKNRNGAFGVKG